MVLKGSKPAQLVKCAKIHAIIQNKHCYSHILPVAVAQWSLTQPCNSEATGWSPGCIKKSIQH